MAAGWGVTSQWVKKNRSNHHRRHYLPLECLESRILLASDLVLSELQTINNSTLADEDGDFSDWIELHNFSAVPVDLNGWHLTDDATDLTKWQFPPVTIAAGDQILVFASDKDRPDPLSELHANFKLNSG